MRLVAVGFIKLLDNGRQLRLVPSSIIPIMSCFAIGTISMQIGVMYVHWYIQPAPLIFLVMIWPAGILAIIMTGIVLYYGRGTQAVLTCDRARDKIILHRYGVEINKLDITRWLEVMFVDLDCTCKLFVIVTDGGEYRRYCLIQEDHRKMKTIINALVKETGKSCDFLKCRHTDPIWKSDIVIVDP
jgi:hypothetical protein